jgi:ADP-heptose:LPS heptosyltransferase
MALLESLDLVVTVDTSVGHLAAAMGKPVWILLATSPDWRWLMGREGSVWYPSVRLFRQTVPRQWSDVMERVAAALRAQS